MVSIFQAYDPAAMKNMEKLYPQVTYYASVAQAINETNLIVILTEWQEFKHLDFKYITEHVRNKVILDTRYLLIQSELIPNDYMYVN